MPSSAAEKTRSGTDLSEEDYIGIAELAAHAGPGGRRCEGDSVRPNVFGIGLAAGAFDLAATPGRGCSRRDRRGVPEVEAALREWMARGAAGGVTRASWTRDEHRLVALGYISRGGDWARGEETVRGALDLRVRSSPIRSPDLALTLERASSRARLELYRDEPSRALDLVFSLAITPLS